MALLKYASNIDLSRNKILNLVEARGYDGTNKDLTTDLKITTAKGTEGDLVLGTAESSTKGNVFILAGQNLEEAKEVSKTSDIDIKLSQVPGITLLNDNSISLKAARKDSDSSSTPKIRIWGQEGVYLAKGTSSATSTLDNINNLPSYIKIEDTITQHSKFSINIDATESVNLGNNASPEAKFTEYFKTATIEFTDNTEGSYLEQIGKNGSGTYEYTLKTTDKGVTETLPNLEITKSLTETGESVSFNVGTFVLNSPKSNPTLSIIQDGSKSEIISTTNTVNDTLTVGKTLELNSVTNGPFNINAEGSTYFNLAKNFDLKDASTTTSKTGRKGSIIHTEGSGTSRETTINVDNINVTNLVSDNTIKFSGDVDINRGTTDSAKTLEIQGSSTAVTSTEVKVGEGKTTNLTVNVNNLSKTAATKIEVSSPSVTRTVNTDTYEETIDSKGYSATANTKYDITSNTSTTLKNKVLTIIAGKDGATATVDGVKKFSGYYTLYVPATTSGLSEEHIDKVNVRNLFSQTAGDFKLGDNNTAGELTSRIGGIILNGSTLSSDLSTLVNLTSPEINIKAQDSSGKGKILVTSPNGGFRLEVDNKTGGADVSKLTIRDITSKNSTITNNITLSSSTEAAAIKVPNKLTVNAVKFTLNQVKDADGTADTSGNSILTSEIKNGAREAKLDVENATVNTKLTSSTESDLEGAVNINTDTGKASGNLTVIGETAKIQSSKITLGTSDTTVSNLTTYIGTQTSSISTLTENISTELTRKLNTDDIVEEYGKSSKNTNVGDEDTGYYRITSKIPFTFTSKDSNLVDLTSENSSLSIEGSTRTQDTNYGLILSSTDAKETLKDIILDNSYTQTEGTFNIADSKNKANTSVSIYSNNTTVESTTLKEKAGGDPTGEYGYSLTVDNSTNTSKLSIRDALFNNEVQIKNNLTLLESSSSEFSVTANGNTTLTAKKSFTFKGNDADNSDSILESTWTEASDETPASRKTSLTIEKGTFKTSLKAKDSTLTNNTTIEGVSLSVRATTSDITSSAVTIGAKDNIAGSLDIYRTNISLNGNSLAETTTSIKRSVNSGDYVERIGLSTGDEASNIYQATSKTQYLLKAYTKYDLYAGGTTTTATTTADKSMPLHISADGSSSEVKAVQLEATDHATIGNASKGGYVDIGAIRVKYDSSSQSLIFGAV